MNKLLMEKNDRLQKQVSQLFCENGYMRQQLHTAPATDASCDSVVTTPQHSLRDANNPAGLVSIAEETLAEFLSKATGTAVDWVQMPGMKPGQDSVGIFAISQSCSGVAARACGLVSLEPMKIAEILKNRPSWFWDCRSLEVFTMFPAGNGGTIELIHTQVCERSLSGSGAGPNGASAAHLVRAEMLPSGDGSNCDGIGVLARNSSRQFLGGRSIPCVSSSALQVEASAVIVDLAFAKDQNFQEVLIATDSSSVYTAAVDLTRTPHWKIYPLVQRIRSLSKGFRSCNWSLIKRSANAAVDCLPVQAKKGIDLGDWISNPPLPFFNILKHDGLPAPPRNDVESV
ncbi:hypothetical protein ABKV19_013378 [Rosa sericea]